MKTLIRRAEESELKGIAGIYAEEFSKPPYYEPWTAEKAGEKVRYFFNNQDLYSIQFDGQLAGFITINPNFMCPGEVAFAEEFALKKEFQGRNIGKIVLKELFEIYKRKGFKKFMGISSTSPRLLELYKLIGFDVSTDSVIVEKHLGD